jgi:hypothetical protein
MPEGPQQPSKQNFFLTNPCGSGKSTWLHTIFTDAHLVDLLAKESHQHLLCVRSFLLTICLPSNQNLGDD